VVALAADPNQGTGQALSSGRLAREYGFTDIDGTQPLGYQPTGVFSHGNFAVND
jgi:hypothetical protein